MTGVRRTVYAPIQAEIRVLIVPTPAGMSTARASSYRIQQPQELLRRLSVQATAIVGAADRSKRRS
eukprot:4377619-Prymnesium_polylepis.1